jgi:hypothetical protein
MSFGGLERVVAYKKIVGSTEKSLTNFKRKLSLLDKQPVKFGRAVPRISARGDRDGDHLSPPTYPGTLGAKRKNLEDRAVEESCEEDHIKDFFSQLWFVPQPPEKARVSNQEINGGHLVWVRRDLVRSREIKPEDCFPVGRHERIVDKPTTLSFS